MAKFLIAEDNGEMRAMLARTLGRGHEIFEARDGEEALALARKNRPDMVLLDIYMPKASGLDVLEALVPELPGTSFLVVTGNEDDEVARKCLELGAFDYITKPIDDRLLKELINSRIAGAF